MNSSNCLLLVRMFKNNSNDADNEEDDEFTFNNKVSLGLPMH